MPNFFNYQTLKFKRAGNVLHAWAIVMEDFSVVSGREHFLIMARSKAGLRRKVASLYPQIKIKESALMKVKVTL